jgi:hypothetical protein
MLRIEKARSCEQDDNFGDTVVLGETVSSDYGTI